MRTEPRITEDQATAIARARRENTQHPVPGYPSGDVMAAYRATEHSEGWIFAPAVANLERDPSLAVHYPYLVVPHSKECEKVPYDQGLEVALTTLRGGLGSFRSGPGDA